MVLKKEQEPVNGQIWSKKSIGQETEKFGPGKKVPLPENFGVGKKYWYRYRKNLATEKVPRMMMPALITRTTILLDKEMLRKRDWMADILMTSMMPQHDDDDDDDDAST